MSVVSQQGRGRYAGTVRFAAAVLLGGGLLAVLGLALFGSRSAKPPPPVVSAFPRKVFGGRNLTVWWDGLARDVQEQCVASGEDSNIHPKDYIGPDSCKECHPRNHATWTKHPHSAMNALASPATVKGDFSGHASITYRGGRATFYRQGDKYLMRLERGDVRRTYEVTQTIGSRFFQYYVGKQTEGPEPPSHHFYRKEHVLFFGYWLDQHVWSPVVHIGPERPDAERPDPFAPPESGRHYAEYAAGCNYCHTTFPLGDMFGRIADHMGEHAPVPLHWSLRDYLETSRPGMMGRVSDLLEKSVTASLADMPDRNMVRNPMADWEAPKYAVTMGISCEACHLGGKKHAESSGQIPPRFFPASPFLFVEKKAAPLNLGRTHDNVNWACGRCHTGRRPQFAAGMSTWNSVEYADAMRGSCYSKLRCIDCHNPHRAIGPKWSLSADEDDALCLKCHDKFRPDAERLAHTHHPAGSDGARCMNCHMPRINEGLQDAVRTHMIYSPTRADMIEANHPNACNLCHTEQSIDWTLGHLKEWYKTAYDEKKIAANYPLRDKPIALGWLKSENAAVRLVAVEALTRGKDARMLPELLDALDDPYLLNRQFAYKGLQERLKLRLDDFGYRFYMSSDERRGPLAALRARLLKGNEPYQP
jgi:predicted CXXCH cytochrome family protein